MATLIYGDYAAAAMIADIAQIVAGGSETNGAAMVQRDGEFTHLYLLDRELEIIDAVLNVPSAEWRKAIDNRWGDHGG